ncbi:uncharacterized protein LOC122383261 isoform X2 [Amphibalanus amphitrite]|nr:uncharacterized protein LOC122383261 isoform X2 [Amphibalanus amphitrite]
MLVEIEDTNGGHQLSSDGPSDSSSDDDWLDCNEDELASLSGTDNCAHRRTWAKRLMDEEINWAKVRGSNLESYVSSQRVPDTRSCSCGAIAAVSCNDCLEAFMCPFCDEAAHAWKPFHRRFCWISGHLQPLNPRCTVATEDEDRQYRNIVASVPLLKTHHRCGECGSGDVELVADGSRDIIVVTERGRHNLCAPLWRCTVCASREHPTAEEWYSHGFFPGSPVHMKTFFLMDVFQLWRGIKFLSPGTSLRAFVQSLNRTGRLACRDGDINQDRFAKAYAEWSYMTFAAQKLAGWDPMICPACGPQPSCIHVDGNAKLYRYKSAGDASTLKPYMQDVCIFNNASVDAHVAETESCNSESSNRCGVSTWAAGRNKTSLPSKRSQDETGLSVATCRHSMVLGAINMYRGEIFAYCHFLHMQFRNLAFMASDVACQYWPWAQRLANRLLQFDVGDTQPFLSVMHATGHAYYCQIKYGGFWQEGSGWAVMETTEQANALLSRAGNPTKHMTAAQRDDYLTDLIISWNERKSGKLMELLISKHARLKKAACTLQRELDEMLREHKVDVNDLPSMVEELRALADALCASDRLSDDNIRNGIVLCGNSIREKSARLLQVDSSKLRSRLRRSRAAEKARLVTLLRSYERLTGEKIDMDDVLDDCLPWQNRGVVDLAIKRNICDKLMRMRRATEEQDILMGEMTTLQHSIRDRRTSIEEKAAWLEGVLSLPLDQRPTLDSGAEGRYVLCHNDDGVVRGLLAMCRRQVRLLTADLLYGDDALAAYFSQPGNDG